MTGKFFTVTLLAVSCLPYGLGNKTKEDGVCPENTYFQDDRCYGVLYSKDDWDESAQACIAQGGKMAVLRNERIFKFLYKLLQWEIHFDYWLGISKVENTWMYADNTSVRIQSLWAPGQPDNEAITEDTGSCVAMSVNHYLLWNDEACNLKYLHVCQTHNENCSPGLTYFNGSCYELSKKRLSFHDAEANCESKGGHLATPTSEEEQKFITQFIRESRQTADINQITTDTLQRTPLWVTVETQWGRRRKQAILKREDPVQTRPMITRCMYISTNGLGMDCKMYASPICEYRALNQTERIDTNGTAS